MRNTDVWGKLEYSISNIGRCVLLIQSDEQQSSPPKFNIQRQIQKVAKDWCCVQGQRNNVSEASPQMWVHTGRRSSVKSDGTLDCRTPACDFEMQDL